MKTARNILLPSIVMLGLISGGIYGFLHKKNEATTDTETETTFAIPEEGVQSDAFSVRYFQQVLHEQNGNVLVAPQIVSNALRAMADIASGETLKELEAAQVSGNIHAAGATVQDFLIAVDINLPRNGNHDGVMPIPFSEDLPLALSLFNGTLAQSSPDPNAQFASRESVTERTRLLAGITAYCIPAWQAPFYADDTQAADFDSASGALPRYQQMRSRGLFRLANAGDDTWRAVALELDSTKNGSVLIGIIPSGSAREFARELTPLQLSSIRKALAEATPQDTLVEFPRIEQRIQAYDMRYTLRKLGLTSLFDPAKADFSRLTTQKIHLSAMVQAIAVSLVESPGKQKASDNMEDAANRISFSRPFIWLIADLTSHTPPEFIGLVEEL